MTTPNPSNQLSTQDELEALKKRPDVDDQQDIVPIGYAGIDGVRRTVPGDEDSAWLKTPPFESRTARYVRGQLVPFVTAPGFAYAFLEPVDVNTRRLLNIWLAWTIPIDANANPHRLSLLPQGRRDEKTNEWYTIAVVNPTLTANFPTVGFGDRVFYEAELSTPVFTGSPVAPIVFRTVLTFDVAIYTSFRLGVGSLDNDATLLDLDYSFSD